VQGIQYLQPKARKKGKKKKQKSLEKKKHTTKTTTKKKPPAFAMSSETVRLSVTNPCSPSFSWVLKVERGAERGTG
jgi:hypothetical protein